MLAGSQTSPNLGQWYTNLYNIRTNYKNQLKKAYANLIIRVSNFRLIHVYANVDFFIV